MPTTIKLGADALISSKTMLVQSSGAGFKSYTPSPSYAGSGVHCQSSALRTWNLLNPRQGGGRATGPADDRSGCVRVPTELRGFVRTSSGISAGFWNPPHGTPQNTKVGCMCSCSILAVSYVLLLRNIPSRSRRKHGSKMYVLSCGQVQWQCQVS